MCCRGYGLNHNSTLLLSYKTFTAAWRGIETVQRTGSSRVTDWIGKYIASRSSLGYQTVIGTPITAEQNTIDMSSDGNEEYRWVDCKTRPIDDDRVLQSELENNIAREITSDERFDVRRVTNLPESQLLNLRMSHVIRVAARRRLE